MKHLYFNELNNPEHTTRLWEVVAIASDGVLGKVGFYPQWRKYVFGPAGKTWYDASCLREIADFTEAQTEAWKEGLNAEKRSQQAR